MLPINIANTRVCQVSVIMIAWINGISSTIDDSCIATYAGFGQRAGGYDFKDSFDTCGDGDDPKTCICSGDASENARERMLARFGPACE